MSDKKKSQMTTSTSTKAPSTTKSNTDRNKQIMEAFEKYSKGGGAYILIGRDASTGEACFVFDVETPPDTILDMLEGALETVESLCEEMDAQSKKGGVS